MDFAKLFDVFSMRGKEASPVVHKKLTVEFRNRVLMLCREVFGGTERSFGSGENYVFEFWTDIHNRFAYRLGRPHLSKLDATRYRRDESGHAQFKVDDAITFVGECSDEQFLDFIEEIFRVDCIWRVTDGIDGENKIVKQINDLLRVDQLAYFLTDIVKEQKEKEGDSYPFHGKKVMTIETVAYPTVIRMENQLVHSEIISPALTLLHNPLLNVANKEFLAALEDFRKADYEDSLAKCCSAFESTLKVACEHKKWPSKQTDTAGPLVKTLITNTSLPDYFEPMLMIVATLRNRISSAHGGGTTPKAVPEHLARYALNTTASAIKLIADEVGLQ